MTTHYVKDNAFGGIWLEARARAADQKSLSSLAASEWLCHKGQKPRELSYENAVPWGKADPSPPFAKGATGFGMTALR